jgi:predicted metal-dependent hydrolase
MTATVSTDLTVRRLGIDLDTPLPRHWAGDAFRTAFFNALSMSFPAGEQMFIDSLKMGLAALPAAERARFEPEVRGFVGQEATHRHVHARFNAHLERQGLVNAWGLRIQSRRAQVEALDVRNWVAVTAATEHLTAVFAEYLLARPGVLAAAPERLQQLWQWHSAEEIEHRSTAFELYGALGGGTAWRVGMFRVVLPMFLLDAARQTLNNLWHDGSWWRPTTWSAAARFMFGRDGFFTVSRPLWKRYRQADFHPAQADDSLSRRWLADHAALVPAVMPAVSAGAPART